MTRVTFRHLPRFLRSNYKTFYIYSQMAYLTKLLVIRTVGRRTLGWQMSNGLERMLKEPVTGYFEVLARYLPIGTEENHEKSVNRACFQAKICNSDLPNGRRIADHWKLCTHVTSPLPLEHISLLKAYYSKMGIFKSSYSPGSSVSTVTRLPEAHIVLFPVACRPALGRPQ